MPETTSQPAVETLEETVFKIAERLSFSAFTNSVEYRRTHDFIVREVLSCLRNERERAAKLAENPYGDEVEALAGDEPKAVGEKIAAAIREGE